MTCQLFNRQTPAVQEIIAHLVAGTPEDTDARVGCRRDRNTSAGCASPWTGVAFRLNCMCWSGQSKVQPTIRTILNLHTARLANFKYSNGCTWGNCPVTTVPNTWYGPRPKSDLCYCAVHAVGPVRAVHGLAQGQDCLQQ
jgi:hypothetical protein